MSVTYHNLKSLFIKSGNSSPYVMGVKSFLNSYYGVRISDIPRDNNFCQKTVKAIIEFQIYNHLTPTGNLNVETWQTIGREMGIVRFENSFFNTPNHLALRSLTFGNRYATMFPTKTHNALIEYAFSDNSSYGKSGGGLSQAEVNSIALGSRQTDTYFGHGKEVAGWEIDIPITLLISEAYKHAMVPEGKTVEEAQKLAYEWIKTNTSEARRLQRSADDTKQKYIDAHKEGKPVPTPRPDPNLSSGSMDLSALNTFGHACHTYMDFFSPAHHGWQKYKMPKMTVKITDPETGSIIGEQEKNDWIKYVQEGLQHKADESAEPTVEEKDNCVKYMRGAFLTTFTDKWFKRAVTSESERKKIYDFIKGQGLSWSEDFYSTEVPQIEIPKEKMNSM
jgi:peptidoglycan hydrolase-like protein with peptidoglycan-binding domain